MIRTGLNVNYAEMAVQKWKDSEQMRNEVDAFLRANGLERDTSRPELGNIITSPMAQEIMGYEQMDYYTPVRRRE